MRRTATIAAVLLVIAAAVTWLLASGGSRDRRSSGPAHDAAAQTGRLPRWSADVRQAALRLPDQGVPAPEDLVEAAATWVDAVVRGDVSAVRLNAERRGCVFNPREEADERALLESLPAERRPPNLPAISSDEVWSQALRGIRPMAQYSASSAHVYSVGALDLSGGAQAWMLSREVGRGSMYRGAAGRSCLAVGAKMLPPEANRDDRAIPCVVVEFLGKRPSGEDSLVMLLLGWYPNHGWIPVAAMTCGAERPFLPAH